MTSSVSGQNEPSLALWLATRADKMAGYCPLGISRLVPQHQRSFFGVLSHIINLLLIKLVRSRGLDIGLVLFLCVYGPRLRSINTQKKNLANIQPCWPHAWSITHISYMYIEAIQGKLSLYQKKAGLPCRNIVHYWIKSTLYRLLLKIYCFSTFHQTFFSTFPIFLPSIIHSKTFFKLSILQTFLLFSSLNFRTFKWFSTTTLQIFSKVVYSGDTDACGNFFPALFVVNQWPIKCKDSIAQPIRKQ